MPSDGETINNLNLLREMGVDDEFGYLEEIIILEEEEDDDDDDEDRIRAFSRWSLDLYKTVLPFLWYGTISNLLIVLFMAYINTDF